jgi:hypothetical protein
MIILLKIWGIGILSLSLQCGSWDAVFVSRLPSFRGSGFEDWVMLANTVYESIVCSAAILRFSPKISEREDGIWIIGVMVITT